MTTDTELRDLLADEAGGPTGGRPGWDDVMRRGRHRQRVRRAQTAALGVVAAGVVVTAVALSTDDPTVETLPPATDPTTTTVGDPTTTTTPTPVGGNPAITAARAQGAFVTVIIPAADPATGFDPCTQLHPRIVEAPEQVLVELVDETVERGRPWAACQATPFSGWATLELTDPLGDRTLSDVATGNEVAVVDGAPLLFPSELPAPFVVDEHDEFAVDGTWTFSWTAGDVVMGISNGTSAASCDRPAEVEVRGTTGQLCMEAIDGEVLTAGVLRWTEEGLDRTIELTDPDGSASLHGGELIAVAEGLEPLGG